MRAVIDTHAVIWMSTGAERRVGARARRFYEKAGRGQCTILVSVQVLIEIAEAAHAGRISLRGGFNHWVGTLFSQPGFEAVDLTLAIVRRCDELYAIPERGDRLLAATAIEWECPLITRDAAIQASGLVPTLW